MDSVHEQAAGAPYPSQPLNMVQLEAHEAVFNPGNVILQEEPQLDKQTDLTLVDPQIPLHSGAPPPVQMHPQGVP